ncbi:unnamed protein product [Hymenolepis diminuta]|uniref:Uncharacterized protein n=1 Tax=Hymenolepis diminuta TaxID=6216 RepID=A0A3P6ZM01_HYMDI|nr:unnamed protein product [Hymenolepis diminuta]
MEVAATVLEGEVVDGQIHPLVPLATRDHRPFPPIGDWVAYVPVGHRQERRRVDLSDTPLLLPNSPPPVSNAIKPLFELPSNTDPLSHLRDLIKLMSPLILNLER